MIDLKDLAIDNLLTSKKCTCVSNEQKCEECEQLYNHTCLYDIMLERFNEE